MRIDCFSCFSRLSTDHPEESSTPAGRIVGGIIAALIAGAIIVVLLVSFH